VSRSSMSLAVLVLALAGSAGWAQEKGPRETPAVVADPLPKGALLRLGSGGMWHPGQAVALAVSHDGKTVASLASDRALRLWDVSSGKKRGVLADAVPLMTPGGRPTTRYSAFLCFSPDGKTLAVGNGGQDLHVWDLGTKKILQKISLKGNQIRAADFSPDGKTLALACNDNVARLYDTTSWKATRTFKGHELAVTDVAFSPDGKSLLTGSMDHTLRLWDMETGKEKRMMEGHRNVVQDVAFSPDGKQAASVGADLTARVWDLTSGKQRQLIPDVSSDVVFLPDGKTLAMTTTLREVRLHDIATGRVTGLVPRASRIYQQITFSPDGSSVLWSAGGQLHLVALPSGEERSPVGRHQGSVTVLAYSPDGRVIASGGYGHTIVLWDARTGKERHTLYGHTGQVSTLAFSPDGRFLVSASLDGRDRSMSLWDVATGKEVRQFRGAPYGARDLFFTLDGKWLVSGHGALPARVWNVATGKVSRELAGRHRIMGLSGDGKQVVAIGYDRMLRHWDVGTWKETTTPATQLPTVYFALLAPGARQFLNLDYRTGQLTLWDVERGVMLRPIGEPLGTVRNFRYRTQGFADFTPDGRMVAAASPKGALMVWEVATGSERCRFAGHPGGVSALAFAPDGKRVASGHPDGTVLVWDMLRKGGGKLTADELPGLWKALQAKDGAAAYGAMCRLGADPGRGVAFLAKKLDPVPGVDPKRLAGLVKDLNSGDFATRRAAEEGLKKLGNLAQPALRKALAGKPSLEIKQRVERLLSQIQAEALTPEKLRAVRAIEVLERVGSPAARKELASLAGGAGGARITREAARSLARLKR
jgi:WD40 repeat protein